MKGQRKADVVRIPSWDPLWDRATTRKTTNGYIVCIVKDSNSGLRFQRTQHIVVWERYWRRRVPSGYCVHHANGNPADNRIANLVCLRETRHMSLHGVHVQYLMGNRSEEELHCVLQRAAHSSVEVAMDPGTFPYVVKTLQEGLMSADPGFSFPPLPLQAIREEADISRREMGVFLRSVNPKGAIVPHTRINEWEIPKRRIPAWVVHGYACFLVDTWAERRLESPDKADEVDVTFASLLNPGYGHLVKVLQQTRRSRIREELITTRTLLERGFGENWGISFGHVWKGVEGLADMPPVPQCRRYQPDL